MRDVILNKCASIERCLKRIHEEYDGHEGEFQTNFSRQDAIVLNLLRACEAAIDLAHVIVRERQIGLPNSGREAFVLLARAGFLPERLSDSMTKMVGFRNVAVHTYQVMDLSKVKKIIDERLSDFGELVRLALTSLK